MLSICSAFRFQVWLPALQGDNNVPQTGTFADPVGSIGSINPNAAQGLYNRFTIFVTPDHRACRQCGWPGKPILKSKFQPGSSDFSGLTEASL
jgi:hypothetical protein